jgi:hypothetical protein
MPESEAEHVRRVMEVLKVKTVIVTGATPSDNHIYLDGKLVYTGPDSKEMRNYWANQPFIMCNPAIDDWECASFDGSFIEEDLIEEAVI